MRISLTLTSDNKIFLPLAHNHGIQALIYDYIDEELASFLHDEGFALDKRKFKLFTFSRILGKVRFLKGEKLFEVTPPFSIIISSPVENFIQSLAENLVKSDGIDLLGTKLYLDSINVFVMPKLASEVAIKMLSPMVMYSTLSSPEGKKKTYYYSPFEKEFSTLLKENLLKKYQALYRRKPNGLDFSVEPLGVDKRNEKIVDYKGTVIKGWMGKYKLKGSPELIALGYDTGLGAKNPQGFGCFEILGKESNKTRRD